MKSSLAASTNMLIKKNTIKYNTCISNEISLSYLHDLSNFMYDVLLDLVLFSMKQSDLTEIIATVQFVTKTSS